MAWFSGRLGLAWLTVASFLPECRLTTPEFPNGGFDDLADAGVWGLMRIRQGNLIRLVSDETEAEWKPRAPRSTTEAVKSFLPFDFRDAVSIPSSL